MIILYMAEALQYKGLKVEKERRLKGRKMTLFILQLLRKCLLHIDFR